MPRHKSTDSERVAGEFTPGSPAFWPQEDFPQGILDGDLVRYVAANELWERESKEDFFAEVKADTDIASAISLKHAALTIDGTSPLSLSGQAISLKNDAAAAITEVDTGTLADSDILIPTSKAVKTAIAVGGGGGATIYWQVTSAETVTIAARTQYPVFHMFDNQGTVSLAAGAELIVHS